MRIIPLRRATSTDRKKGFVGPVQGQRTLSGTHKANMMGIPPTKQKINWRDMVISRVDGEKIAEEWTVSELAGQLLSKSPTA